MSTNCCKKHSRYNCSTCRPSAASGADDLTNPGSALHQATFGGYDSGSSYGSSSSCESSLSSDSGSSSYDSGSC